MQSDLGKLQPSNLWKNFQSICQIPHPSKKEAQIIEFMKQFGENLGLETIVDDIGNVIIRKPATAGMENRKGIVLQGHLDMVPQKNSDVAHNFEIDPIQAYIDGDWVTAKGTTLGADNGIGVAAAMAVLESTDLEHGLIEALFTIDEETGMTGAFNLTPKLLQGDILINMDSEDEGELYIGCAGGIDSTATFNFTEEQVPANSAAYKISVTGLKGGHSGVDIHLERANANKIMNRILWYGNKNFDLRLASIEGGSLRNAIPRESFAVISLPEAQVSAFKSYIADLLKTIQNEFGNVEPELNITAETTEMPQTVIDKKTATNLFSAIYACPHGVTRMSTTMKGLVETSSNLAIVQSDEKTIIVANLLRSSVDSARDELQQSIQSVFELAGATVENNGAYPGWKPNINSAILTAMKQIYNDLYGKIPEIRAIHAGLECGLLGNIYPNWDMISFGPTIRFPHSPDEKVNIKTVEKFWNFLVATLKNVPLK